MRDKGREIIKQTGIIDINNSKSYKKQHHKPWSMVLADTTCRLQPPNGLGMGIDRWARERTQSITSPADLISHRCL